MLRTTFLKTLFLVALLLSACGGLEESSGLPDAAALQDASAFDAQPEADAGALDADVPDSTADPIVSEAESKIAPFIEGGWFPGVAGAIVRPEGTTFFAFGATAKDGSIAPDEHTVYEIGSITKTFTGLLLADRVVTNQAQLADDVQDYLPASVTMPSWPGTPISLLHLSTHFSGLPRLPSNMPFANPLDPYADYDEALLYEFLNGYTLLRAPGETFEYSNLAVGLLGHVLARTASTSYEALLSNRVLEPLGMLDTSITLSTNQLSRLAPPYDAELEPAANWDLAVLKAAGNVRSTASDMSLYANAIIDRAALSDAITLATTEHAVIQGPVGIGLGWFTVQGGTYLDHGGATGGYRAFVAIVPSEGVAVYIATNSATYLLDRIGSAMTNALRGLSYAYPVAPPLVAVPTSTLDDLVGAYRLGGTTLTVTREEDQLFGQLTNQPRFRGYAASDSVFHLRAVEASLTFERDAGGIVVAASIDQDGQTYRFVRQ